MHGHGESPHVRVQWHGHATTSITDSGTTVLTDPVLTGRVAHLRRRRGPDPSGSVRSPDAVVLSHLHGDHTHVPSLKLVEGTVPIIVPAGAVDAVRGLRQFDERIISVRVGDEVKIGAVTIRVTPAEHDGRRWPQGPQRTAAIGYVVEGQARTYFAGDTAWFPEMADWAPECDVALIPVGGWGPSLGPGHLDARAAAEAVANIGARHSVPIHFGTLWPIGLGNRRPEMFHDPGSNFVSHAHRLGMIATELAPGEALTVSAGVQPHEPDA